MRKDKILAAVQAAQEFVRRAGEYEVERSKTYDCGDFVCHHDAPKEGGALRRQSMELTRALAEMRKP